LGAGKCYSGHLKNFSAFQGSAGWRTHFETNRPNLQAEKDAKHTGLALPTFKFEHF
jgi:hypothetical protein